MLTKPDEGGNPEDNLGEPLYSEHYKTDAVDIENRFTFHPSKDDQSIRYQRLRSKAKEFAIHIGTDCPPSRERLIALTKLEECVMWANASIARNE